MSRQFPGQVANQVGNSLPGPPQQNANSAVPLMQNTGGHRNMEPDLVRARKFMINKILDFLMKRQHSVREVTKKVMDVVMRLEDGLFRTATSKEEYMNLETLETRLSFLCKRLPLIAQSQHANYPSSVSTMIPTPGLPQSVDNSTVAPIGPSGAMRSGSCNSSEGASNFSANAGGNSMVVQRVTSQMIPTPGFNNTNNSGTSTNNSVESTKVSQPMQQNRRILQQKSSLVGGPATPIIGNSSNPSRKHFDQNQPHMLQGDGYGINKATSAELAMNNQPNYPSTQQAVNTKHSVDQQKQQQLTKSEPGIESLESPNQSQQNATADNSRVQSAAVLQEQPRPISCDQNVKDEFRHRISGQIEAERNQLTPGCKDPNLERQHVNQQRWLLFLRHARSCTAPDGKCPGHDCSSAQKLWKHMESCKISQCQYPRCDSTKNLVHHYRHCRNPRCPVCVPVRSYIKNQKRPILRSGFPGQVGGLNKSCDDGDLQPSLKRMKIEQPSQSLDPESASITPHQHVDTGMLVKSEVTGVNMEIPEESPSIIEMKIDHMDDNCMQSLSGDAAVSNDHMEIVKVENEVDETKNENVVETKSGKSKVKGVSMMELFTPEQVREHIIGLRQWVGQSRAKAERNKAMEHTMSVNSCQLCAVERLAFEPPPLYCTPCGVRIRRNVMYYTTSLGETRHYFCIPCYNEFREDTIQVDGLNVLKARLEKKRNDEEAEEWWVQCDKCESWQHQICALFNGKRNEGGQAEYTCPNCYIEEVESGTRTPLPQTAVLGAKDLPKTILSDHIEQRLFRRLGEEREERARFQGKTYDEVPGAESLVVRVVSSVDKKLEVKQRFLEVFQEENYPTEFAYKSKVVLLFQNIEGVEVCLFGMYVQEFGSDCEHPNHRRVYLSYLDSVKYFRPEIKTVTGEALRTFVYHEILIGYLEYCKKRGFTSCYIWACPPLKGEDYILYCHPEIQKTPKSDKLREWYLAMLRKASKENIVVELTNLYDHFFKSEGECKAKVTASRLPYFDGDYWPGAAEDILNSICQEEDGKRPLKKGALKKPITKRALKVPGQPDISSNASKDLLLIRKLGEAISSMKEDFIMVHLQHSCSHCCILMVSGNRWVCNKCKNFQLCDKCHESEQKLEDKERHPVYQNEKHMLCPVEINDVTLDTKDEDDILESEFLDTRQAFLTLCQLNHYQYDTLRRAKHSSMMVLYHLHNPTAPAFVINCVKCHSDIEAGQGWRCEICPDYDVCNACYQKTRCTDHPHKITNNPSTAEREAQNTEAREQRVLQLKKMLELLVHASQCRSVVCPYDNCRKVKGLFRHGIQCRTRSSGGCLLCKRMWYILQLHARACKDSHCHVPRCSDLKEHVRRLQRQSDNRRRAAVMEMMRQRAAEVS